MKSGQAPYSQADARPFHRAEPIAETAHSEALAIQAGLAAERALGFVPRDVSDQKCGYDIESAIPGTGRLRLEVKGRARGAQTVTKNEILTALNKPDEFILAIVTIGGDRAEPPQYVRHPFQREPDFGVASVSYDLNELLRRAQPPA